MKTLGTLVVFVASVAFVLSMLFGAWCGLALLGGEVSTLLFPTAQGYKWDGGMNLTLLLAGWFGAITAFVSVTILASVLAAAIFFVLGGIPNTKTQETSC